MIKGKEKFIPIFAIILLSIGFASSIYVFANNINNDYDSNHVIVYNDQYSINYLFSVIKIKFFDNLNCSGIALDDLILNIGINCPNCYNYKIIGDDGYSKTVTWQNMKNGILTQDKRVFFSDLPKAFNVRYVKEIEVQ
jgi:hypothetical protein